MESLTHFLIGSQVNADAAPVVGIQRLNDDRVTHAINGADSLVFATEHGLLRYRQTHVSQQAMGTFLVARQRRGDGTGIAGHGGLDTF